LIGKDEEEGLLSCFSQRRKKEARSKKEMKLNGNEPKNFKFLEQ